MEFGKVDNLEVVDWTLPPEGPGNNTYLQHFKGKGKIYIGAPAWGCKEWLGQIYPPGTPPAEFLFHYARNFNCIELNTTHYRIPDTERVAGWRKLVPSDFIFCPKISQLISHRAGGLRDRELLATWLNCLASFGENLGPCFLQLPPYFSYEMKAELFHFLKSWPNEFELLIELRHSSWFGQPLGPLAEYLRGRGIGLVILDVAGRRDLLHATLTAPFSLLRLIGNDLHPSDFARARDWSARLKAWANLPRFYFIVHEPDDVHAPGMAEFVIERLNQECEAGLTPLAKPLV